MSTRNTYLKFSSKDAIIKGLAPDGGLFVPETVPVLTEEEWTYLETCTYNQGAALILEKYLTDFTSQEIWDCIQKAYNSENFANNAPAKLQELSANISVLELWHGPTCAFKDIALQLMPHLLKLSMENSNDSRQALILAATSGDTGKAALEGFQDKQGVKVIVFYPKYGVSPIQELQMVTQKGSNLEVIAVDGNFDDAQRAVKQIFQDTAVSEVLQQQKIFLSSANSINLARLLPQIVYYCVSAQQLKSQGKKDITFVVPTGNFGNILACYYAKLMGAPIHHICCASNNNKVLADFIKTGNYNIKRKFYKTFTPSMDILVSSNLERLLYEIGRDSHWVQTLMNTLETDGKYQIDGNYLAHVQSAFSTAYCSDPETLDSIRTVWQNFNYLIDPHTAVAFYVMNQLDMSGHKVVVSTASPYKFPKSVAWAIGLDIANDFEAIEKLNAVTGMPIPNAIKELKDQPQLHHLIKSVSQLKNYVQSTLLK